MPRKPAPEADETVDQALPDWPLPAEIIQAAAAGHAAELTALLAEAGLGGKVQADLLVLAIDCWRKYAPLAASLERLTAERDATRRHLEQLRRYHPASVREVKELAEILASVETSHAGLCNEVGRADSAERYCRFFHALFDPARKSFYNARPCPEIHAFFRQAHAADPFTTDWRAIGKFTTPQPRPIISSPARVNEA